MSHRRKRKNWRNKFIADNLEYRSPRQYCDLDGKPCYDKKGAQTAINDRRRRAHMELRMYQCGDHWHLTKQMRRNNNPNW